MNAYDRRTTFSVQYKNSIGVWCNLYGNFSQYSTALEKLLTESKEDPECSHRIIKQEVLGYITGEESQ